MDLGIAGLASQFDWRAFIDKISEIERTPQNRLLLEQSRLEQRGIAYGGIVTQLNVLKNRVDDLKGSALFDTRATTVGNAAVATAAATSAAGLGSHTFDITQLATNSIQQGAANIGHRLNNTSDVDALELSDAAFATAVTAGTLTVNGKQITIEATDSLGDVFDKINTATGNVTATYDETTDKIQMQVSGGGTIVLGSATDTSNFLSVARLYNNGTDTVTSAFSLGAVQLGEALATANLETAISDGGSGAGSFKINGVSIAFDAATDSVTTVLNRINASAAGVTASYDLVNDRFLLANKTTGDVGMALEDVTGNFLAATGLSTGSLSRGKNLLYTIDDGGELTSLSNTITQASSGLTGISVTALAEGETTVDVKADTVKIRKAVTDFIAEYNKTQSMIDAETASSTDADGIVTAGLLAGEREAIELSSQLRSRVNGVVAGLSGSIRQLAGLGINSNGTDDTIELDDSAALDTALAENLDDVKALFSDATSGIGVVLSSYLLRTAGDDGSLVALQDNLTKQSSGIDTQISDLERLVQANKERLIAGFVAMEKAQATINQQLDFLKQRFGTS